VALEFARGCFDVVSEKVWPVLLLTGLFKLFGPSPHWEPGLLIIDQCISVLVIYEAGSNNTRTRLGGLKLPVSPDAACFSIL